MLFPSIPSFIPSCRVQITPRREQTRHATSWRVSPARHDFLRLYFRYQRSAARIRRYINGLGDAGNRYVVVPQTAYTTGTARAQDGYVTFALEIGRSGGRGWRRRCRRETGAAAAQAARDVYARGEWGR